MDYKEKVKQLEDNNYLISMVPVDELLRFGYEAGLCQSSRVLDLCCGYGTVLKVWSQAFGICGVGVDLNAEFIEIGKKRLQEAEVDTKIELRCADVFEYQDESPYDVVICSETFGNIAKTFALGERYLKKGGTLAFYKLYSKVPNPPKELVDFDEEVLPLPELNRTFNELGYHLTCMASDSNGMWEHYVVNWSAKRDLHRLRQNPDDKALAQWMDKWYEMYFNYRRPYEGQALFGLERF